MTDEIFTGIECVRIEGQADMLERFEVVEECQRLGYAESARWVSQNPCEYARFIVEAMKIYGN